MQTFELVSRWSMGAFPGASALLPLGICGVSPDRFSTLLQQLVVKALDLSDVIALPRGLRGLPERGSSIRALIPVSELAFGCELVPVPWSQIVE